MPNNDRKSAEQLALKCCETIANSVIQYKGVRISVTLSAGVSDLTQSDKQVVDLYLRADHNLYLSKQRGRNRVTLMAKRLLQTNGNEIGQPFQKRKWLAYLSNRQALGSKHLIPQG